MKGNNANKRTTKNIAPVSPNNHVTSLLLSLGGGFVGKFVGKFV